MKGILGLLRPAARSAAPTAQDTTFFTTAFAGQGVDAARLVPWEARAVEVGASKLSRRQGGRRLAQLWAQDATMAVLGSEAIERLARFCLFAHVPAGREVIRQDEYGNFMAVVLDGTLAIERQHAGGEQQRLALTQPGDILGEMSLIDSGIRFSACTTLSDCEIAVLSAEAMDDMMDRDPMLAASVVTLLARKLSQRLRVIGARLSEQRQ